MRSLLAILPVGALAACGGVSGSAHEAEVVGRTGTERAAASYTRFLGCTVEREDYARCYACDVTVHDAGEEGVIVYATHWEHELKPWEGRDGLMVTISGEVEDSKMGFPFPNAVQARDMFETGVSWCQSRGPGNDHFLKDEIDTVFGGSE